MTVFYKTYTSGNINVHSGFIVVDSEDVGRKCMHYQKNELGMLYLSQLCSSQHLQLFIDSSCCLRPSKFVCAIR